MKSKELISKLNLALNSPTKYVSPSSNWGSFIDGKFIFDCVLLIKAIGWGWNADKKKSHGGAIYKSNNVPDSTCLGLINSCKDVSTDFSYICPGELVYMKDHVGIYVGEGKVIECTVAWNTNKVVKSEISDSGIRTYKGVKAHNYKWEKHGKIPWVEYEDNIQNEFILCAIKSIKLSYGSRNELVGLVQRYLKSKGYYKNGKYDNYYGDFMRTEVIRWQRNNGLLDDGVIAFYSWSKILGL